MPRSVNFAEARAHSDRRRRHLGAAACAAARDSIARSLSIPIPPRPSTTAAEAFKLQRGVCQDLTHIFIAAARQLGIPARYIGGHFWRADGVTEQEAGHAWAEAYVDNLGWVGFDPANGICTTDAHVRVAVGLD